MISQKLILSYFVPVGFCSRAETCHTFPTSVKWMYDEFTFKSAICPSLGSGAALSVWASARRSTDVDMGNDLGFRRHND